MKTFLRFLFIVNIFSLLAESAFAENHFVLEFQRPLTAKEMNFYSDKLHGRLKKFSKDAQTEYFQRLYSLETSLEKKELSRQAMSFSLLKNIEDVNAIETYSVIPTAGAQAPTNDPLSPYQWGLFNQGQVVTSDVSDITTQQVPGRAGIDVGLGQIQNLKVAKNPVVAVIDFGVDVNHPDIKDNIFQNAAECVNGEIPLNPKEDKDGNGYVGDCKGWNFTGPGDAGSNRVVDEDGHGTHVSGIMAAIAGNGTGITGVHSQIKILPLQVLRKTSSAKDFASRSDWIAKAILYATKMKVDVINLSLGWPLFLDKPYLREAVQEAIRQGVVVVAAAGNNNHSAPIFPCAYEGVICVGALNNDGTVSAFSNFGGQVDVLAPGDNILSLIPMNLDPQYFSVQGYDYKSGTSQAAPFVSAEAALLKAMNPDASVRQILGKILQSSKDVQDPKKYFSGGMIQISNAVSTKNSNLVRPILKESNLVATRFADKSFTYNLKLENLSAQAQQVRYALKTGSSQITLQNPTGQTSIPAWQEISLPIFGHFLEAEGSNHVELAIQIQTATENKTYHYAFELARDLTMDSQVSRLTVPMEGAGGLRTMLSRALKNPPTQYYVQKTDANGTTLSIFELANNQLKPVGSLQLPGVQQILTLLMTDANLDGQLDYEIQAVFVDQNKKKSVQFLHYDKQLKPLWGSLSAWDFPVQSVLMPDSNLQSMRVDDKVLGPVSVPVFIGKGIIPDADQDAKPFEPKDMSVGTRLYYLLPKVENGKVSLQTREIDSPKNLKQWHSTLQLRYQDDIRLMNLLEGQKLLISMGEGFQRSPAFLSYAWMNDHLEFRFQALQSSSVLDGFALDPMMDLNFSTTPTYALVGEYNSQRWDLLQLGSSQARPIASMTPKDSSESLQIYLKSFRKNSDVYSFVQTPSEILLQKSSLTSTATEQWTYPFHVTTFISSDIYADRAYPVITSLQGERVPALLVDSSQIVAQYVYLMAATPQGLVTPVKSSLQIPTNCVSMNPIVATENSAGKFVFLCQKEKNVSELWTLPME